MTKTCSGCDQTLELEKFYKKPRHKTYKGLAGYSSLCKVCYRSHRAEYVKNNPDTYKNSARCTHIKRYGITVADYNRMFSEQGGCCKACKRHQDVFKRRLVIDHCHQTGKVRGLLCISCNLCLGYVNDNKNTLLSLMEYLDLNSELADHNTSVVELNSAKKVG